MELLINYYDFIVLINSILILFFIIGAMYSFYSEEVRKEILDECKKGSIVSRYSYMRHKWTSPSIARFVGIIMLSIFVFISIVILELKMKTGINVGWAIILFCMSIIMQTAIIMYIIRMLRKIRSNIIF